MVAAAVTLAVLAVVCPAPAFDAEATFARGTTIFGLQVGGGAANNIEGHRTLSDISFVNASPAGVLPLLLPVRERRSSGARSSRGSKGGSSTISRPKEATAEGLKLAMRYHLIGFGRLVPYLEGQRRGPAAPTSG